jgi:hypothetical protein
LHITPSAAQVGIATGLADGVGALEGLGVGESTGDGRGDSAGLALGERGGDGLAPPETEVVPQPASAKAAASTSRRNGRVLTIPPPLIKPRHPACGYDLEADGHTSDRLAAMRGFLFGLALLVLLTISVLSIRPGGLRQQLRFAARRFRIALVLGGIYIVGSGVMRIGFSSGYVADYGPAVLALALGVAFVILAQDPHTKQQR